jgi:hypothetical protein
LFKTASEAKNLMTHGREGMSFNSPGGLEPARKGWTIERET